MLEKARTRTLEFASSLGLKRLASKKTTVYFAVFEGKKSKTDAHRKLVMSEDVAVR